MACPAYEDGGYLALTGAPVTEQSLTTAPPRAFQYTHTPRLPDGTWDLTALTSYAFSGAAPGLVEAESFSLLGGDVVTVSADGGQGSTASWVVCGGVVVATPSCPPTSTQVYEVLGFASGATTTATLYDGTLARGFTLNAPSDDGGLLPTGPDAVCNAAPVCGGLSNDYYLQAPEAAVTTGIPTGTGTGFPNENGDGYRGEQVTILNQPAASSDTGHTTRFIMYLDGLDGTLHTGNFRMAYARDAALSTRTEGTFAVNTVLHTYTFTFTCPAQAPWVVPYDDGNGDNDPALYFSAAQLGAGFPDTKVVFQDD